MSFRKTTQVNYRDKIINVPESKEKWVGYVRVETLIDKDEPKVLKYQKASISIYNTIKKIINCCNIVKVFKEGDTWEINKLD